MSDIRTTTDKVVKKLSFATFFFFLPALALLVLSVLFLIVFAMDDKSNSASLAQREAATAPELGPGFSMVTDQGTGCQYLVSPSGDWQERRGSTRQQLGCGTKSPAP